LISDPHVAGEPFGTQHVFGQWDHDVFVDLKGVGVPANRRCPSAIESSILDFSRNVLYAGQMNLSSIGYLIAQQRRARGLTLAALASSAGVGRSTLAALEGGKLPELGFAKVARLCDALGLVLEARPLELDAPLMPHRHLTEAAGRDLTKAAIEDVVVRGDIAAWRGLVHAIRARQQSGLVNRVKQVVAALSRDDPKVRAFATLLFDVLRSAQSD
jgi:transcriptional regulator with XRE-family HTH domain